MLTPETPEQEFIRMLEELPLWMVYSREHDAWWGPNHRGYRTLVADAGRYTKAEAAKICDANNKRIKMHEPGPAEEMVLAPEAFPRLAKLAKDAETWKREAQAWRAMQDKSEDIYINGPHAGPERMKAAHELGLLVAERDEAQNGFRNACRTIECLSTESHDQWAKAVHECGRLVLERNEAIAERDTLRAQLAALKAPPLSTSGEVRKALTVEEARALRVCRICHKKDIDGPGLPFVYNFGREFAHQACLDSPSPVETPKAQDTDICQACEHTRISHRNGKRGCNVDGCECSLFRDDYPYFPDAPKSETSEGEKLEQEDLIRAQADAAYARACAKAGIPPDATPPPSTESKPETKTIPEDKVVAMLKRLTARAENLLVASRSLAGKGLEVETKRRLLVADSDLRMEVYNMIARFSSAQYISDPEPATSPKGKTPDIGELVKRAKALIAGPTYIGDVKQIWDTMQELIDALEALEPKP